eukprot:1619066-Amphidinium_carterae.3
MDASALKQTSAASRIACNSCEDWHSSTMVQRRTTKGRNQARVGKTDLLLCGSLLSSELGIYKR